MKSMFAMGFQTESFVARKLQLGDFPGFPDFHLPDFNLPQLPGGGGAPLPPPAGGAAPAAPPPSAAVPPSYYPYPYPPVRSAYPVQEAPKPPVPEAPVPAAAPSQGIPTGVYVAGGALLFITTIALLTRG